VGHLRRPAHGIFEADIEGVHEHQQVALAGTDPPDRALRQAMLTLRKTGPNPAHWASFAVFGLPEQPQAAGKPPTE